MHLLKKIKKLLRKPSFLGGFSAAAIVGIGSVALLATWAAATSIIVSTNGLTATGNASIVDDPNSSSGKVIQFGTRPSAPSPEPDTTADSCVPSGGSTLTVGSGGQYPTISAAAGAAQPGDLILISGGTYNERLSVPTSGSEGRHIIYCGKPDEKVVIESGSGDRGLIEISGKSHLSFINMTVANSSNFGVYADNSDSLVFKNFEVNTSQDGGLVVLGSSNLLVDGCNIHGTNSKGGDANHEALSIAEGSTNFEVKNCKVYDNGEEGIDAKYNREGGGKIHDNVVWNNNGPNIYADSTNNVDIYNNVSYGAKGSSKAGIAVAAETAYDGENNPRVASNIRIYNNISYGNAGGGVSFYTEPGGRISDVSIINNTVVDNQRNAIEVNTDGLSGNNPVFNNIFSGNGIGGAGLKIGENFTGDAQFVNPSAGDYHLRAGSAAINAGVVGAPAFDKDGKSRPLGGGFDMGAYEQ